MLMIASEKTVSEIAEEMLLSVKTINTYRSRILEKMGLKNNAKIMHYAVKQGLVD
jgi:DNA-binding NarL/FixJ family response regulator